MRTLLRPPAWLILVGAALAVAVGGVGGVVYVNTGSGRSPTTKPIAWLRLGTDDVHSLAFDPADPQRLYFGHHGGLLGSNDGGRKWAPLSVREDAMSMSAATDGSLVIAGHDVFAVSADGGRTWRSIPTDLPTLDIHGFTRDPDDPKRMWAYPASGGLWESTDAGDHWARVQADNVAFPLALGGGGPTRLLGVAVEGLIASDDGGRSWKSLPSPPAYPVTALAATRDGAVLYAGSPSGLWSSTDEGRSWTATGYTGSAFALATTGDGRTVAVVSKETDFFRSSDGGRTWRGA